MALYKFGDSVRSSLQSSVSAFIESNPIPANILACYLHIYKCCYRHITLARHAYTTFAMWEQRFTHSRSLYS